MKTALSAMPISLDAKIPATNVASIRKREATTGDREAPDRHPFEIDCDPLAWDGNPFEINPDAIEIDPHAFEIDRDPFEIDPNATECDRITFEMIRCFMQLSLSNFVVTPHHIPGNSQIDQSQVQPSGVVESSWSECWKWGNCPPLSSDVVH